MRGNGSIPGTGNSISPVYTEPSSLPTMKLLTSAWGKARHVTAIGLLCLCCSSSVSWGCDSMSRFHEHSRPSVDTLIKLWAFWVPTTLRQYTGCCNRDTCLFLVSLQYLYNKHMLTWIFWSSRMQFCVLGWEVPVLSMDPEDEETTVLLNVCSSHLIIQHPIQQV